jgi:methylated-DNA-[protein]-cysteine S-methyltransferase
MACFHGFSTNLGASGIAWTQAGICAVVFPQREAARVQARLKRRAPGAVETDPPPVVDAVVKGIQQLVSVGRADLADALLDYTNVPDFDRSVYEETRRFAAGETRTYGEIARALGDVALSQRVGQALGRNPFPIVVPCHRVVGADGRMTGFSAPGGTAIKRKLLQIEGALAPDLFE